MRLFEAVIDANHRAVAGDASAGLRPADYAESLPVIALTCVDPRLNALFPSVLGLPGEQFIWLRNAGNIITGPLSSTMRSLALACAVKGGEEVAIIGHTDCQVAKTTMVLLLDKLKTLGVDRSRLPDNLSDFFGTFGSERQNVIKAVEFARTSPLIGPKVPVHGLMIDVTTGKLEWVVNGYEMLAAPVPPKVAMPEFAALGALGADKGFDLGEMKFPDMKIGDAAMKSVPTPPQQVRLVETPMTEEPEATPAQIAVVAERNWPKAPPPTLPPLRKKSTPPPPIQPRPRFPK